MSVLYYDGQAQQDARADLVQVGAIRSADVSGVLTRAGRDSTGQEACAMLRNTYTSLSA
jgi:hypothetical protein